MSNGSGAPYAETWDDKLTDTPIANSEKMFDKFVQKVESTFYPFNSKATAHTELSKLIQKSFKEKNREINNGFQCYITNFQNLSPKSRIKEESTLIKHFLLGVDQKITTMILSVSNIPTTSNGWVDQAKIFHTQKMCILALCTGHAPPQANFPSCPQQDPKAMDIDTVTLSKLTLVE